MTDHHDAGAEIPSEPHAPRHGQGPALQFTGERCLPWLDDVQIVYEHLHRYHLAARYAEGKRVLDLGSGEGYGASILAERALHVTAVDVDAESVAHGRATYATANLDFETASALDLGASASWTRKSWRRCSRRRSRTASAGGSSSRSDRS
jgi:SAM-dependent methyltransferase